MHYPCGSLVLLGLLGVDLLLVVIELSALKDVAVSVANLSGAGRETCEKTTALELVSDVLVDLAGGSTAVPLGDEAGRRLEGGGLRALLHVTEVDTVVALVPVTEGGSIDLDHSTLHEGLRPNKLVGGGVVLHIVDTALAGHGLRPPREVSLVKTESTPLEVPTTSADGANADSTRGKLGTSGGASKAELTLQLVDLASTSGVTLLLEVRSGSAHCE